MDGSKKPRLSALSNEEALKRFLDVKTQLNRVPSMTDYRDHTQLNAQGLSNRLGGSWLNVVFAAGRLSASHDEESPKAVSHVEKPLDLIGIIMRANVAQIDFLTKVFTAAGKSASVGEIEAIVEEARAQRQALMEEIRAQEFGQKDREVKEDERPGGPIGDPESESQ